MMVIAARVGGAPVTVEEVDARETRMRAVSPASSLPLAGTSEGRQLRRWLTQLIVTERVVAAEAARLGVLAAGAPTAAELLPDVTARLEVGSITAAVLADPLARALFGYVTDDVDVTEDDITSYHARNPMRFAAGLPRTNGWQATPVSPPLSQVRAAIAAHLLAAARRRAFRCWLDGRCARLVVLAPGYEHPGDPRQPDNTHKH